MTNRRPLSGQPPIGELSTFLIIFSFFPPFFHLTSDSNIRFDFALRLANELQIDVNEICSASPFLAQLKKKRFILHFQTV